MKTNLKFFALGISVAVGLLGMYALAVSIPNPFTAGDVISAAKMNANFEAMKTAIDTLETKVATLETKNTALEAFKTGLATAKGYPRASAIINGISTVNLIRDQWSSTGGTITYTRTGVGRYTLAFPGFPISLQFSQVQITGTTDALCGMNSVSGNLLVECRDLAGADKDTVFMVVVFN